MTQRITNTLYVCNCGVEHPLLIVRDEQGNTTVEPISISLKKTWPHCYCCSDRVLWGSNGVVK